VRAIILAAGRGSRLNEMTDNQPKCLTELGGHPLLEWQITALRSAGIDDITIVTGYLNEVVEAIGVPTVHNPIWSKTNMVGSFLCAKELIDRPTIVSYSDIVYGPEVVESLLASDASLGVSYDESWEALWRERFEDPLSDAESFRIDDRGVLQEIGGKVSKIGDIEGQFLGLLRFTPSSMFWVGNMIDKNPELAASLDMTSMLARLLADGLEIHGVPIKGKWCEIDTQSDLRVATRLLQANKLTNLFV
jgi:L-glutamine-phosphate cytidylyltransferase